MQNRLSSRVQVLAVIWLLVLTSFIVFTRERIADEQVIVGMLIGGVLSMVLGTVVSVSFTRRNNDDTD